MSVYKHDNRIVLTLDAGGTNLKTGPVQSRADIIPCLCRQLLSNPTEL